MVGIFNIKDNINIEIPVGLYNDRQLHYINEGLRLGLDISWYVNPVFSWIQMHEIKQGLQAGHDVSWYAKPEFDAWQMEQILMGLDEGLDVAKFAKPEYTHQQMNAIRYELLRNKRK